MLNSMKEFIRDRLPTAGDAEHPDETPEERHLRQRRERQEQEEERYRKRERKRHEQEEKKDNQRQVMKKYAKEVINNNNGLGYKVCDMERLKRFIVLGSEFNTYYCKAQDITIDAVQCVNRLLGSNKYKEILDTIEQYSREGRVAKEEPLLTVLAICALSPREDVKKAAYEKVNIICNIPTKLFKFIDQTHSEIVRKRIQNPPAPQPYTGKARKRKQEQMAQVDAISELKIAEEGEEEERREPSENVDETLQPPKKKKKKKKANKEFKTVNVKASKSLGWGRMRRNGVARFYTDERKDACRLLYLMTKYKQRHNWDHKTVMQYSHPRMKGDESEEKNLVIKYCTRGYDKVVEEMRELASKPDCAEKMSTIITYIETVDAVKNLKPEEEGHEAKLVEILTKFGGGMTGAGAGGKGKKPEEKRNPIQIVREHIPTGFLNSVKVWEMMLQGMPMTAMIRNLGKMSSLKMFEDNKTNTDLVINALNDTKRLQSARVHPVKLLIASETYGKGRGDKGSLVWDVNRDIIKALDAAFYKSFKSPDLGKTFKTDLKHMLALDVSGSMQGGGCMGCEAISPAKATAAMAMVTWNIEDNVDIMGFGGHFKDLKPMLKKSMLVSEAMQEIGKLNFGATDCSLPMVFALTEKREVDVFIVYTDCETRTEIWKPMEALRIYNHVMKRSAKLIVVAMTSAGFTIADPDSNDALDICGFDANVPEIIFNFLSGSKDLKCNVCDECTK